ncbi:hypothetical protein [Phocaeicola vulgatus]|uniref:hypothetical protein n=1 Tax=Phocaeicola vulgatus TaxID=821 RepID=UPI000C22519F|nr:hypothetical protein [Phocaeicola vulgatus]
MSNRRFHSTGKGNSAPFRQSKVTPQAVFGKIILAGGSGIFPKNPALPGCGPFGACGIKSPVPHQ